MENMLDRLIEENKYLVQYGKVADYIPAYLMQILMILGFALWILRGGIYIVVEIILKKIYYSKYIQGNILDACHNRSRKG